MIGWIGENMPEIQSKIVNKLLNLYDGTETCCLEKNGELFYDCLNKQIIESAEKTGNKEVALKQYEMSVSSYLESKLIDFNTGIVAFFISIVALLDINLNIITIGILLIIMAGTVGCWSVKNHIKERKLSEILFILRNINEKNK